MSEPGTNAALKPKWRPALWMVVFGVFMLVALLPLAGLLLVIGIEHAFDVLFQLRSIGGLLVFALGSIAMAIVIGAVFLRTLLRPLQELISRTREIEAGSEDAFRNLDTGGTQEIATLGERFFLLARRLSERSNYLTLFTTHVSHELKTPLTSIQGAAELLRDEGEAMKPEQRKRFLDNMIADSTRLADLSTRLRELARADVADTGGECSLSAVIDQCAKQASLKLELLSEEEVMVGMSQVNAAIAWQHLADNAAQHGAKTLRVNLSPAGRFVTALIGDDGAPISAANRTQMFDPFFTTRRETGGTGMGLGIAQAMLRSHGGALEASLDDVFKFELKIPLAVRA